VSCDVLLVGASDTSGGAARAAYRLHRGLSEEDGVRSRFLVQERSSDDPKVIGPKGPAGRLTSKVRRSLGDTLARFANREESGKQSLNILPSGMHWRINALSPDIVHLHWIGHEAISIREIAKIDAPVVWTLHDMWAFQGTQHYSGSQTGESSGQNSWRERWLRRWKKHQWAEMDLHVVTPSRWLAEEARCSEVLDDRPIISIPNGLDLSTYKPINEEVARSVFRLPHQVPLVLFGAVNVLGNPRKGAHLLRPALETLLEMREEVELVIFGASGGEDRSFKGRVHYAGELRDDTSLALLYSAADAFVLPSMQDNLPNTVAEALACGTPCVGFDVGGVPEMIEHKKSGYVAEPFNTDDLARGLDWVLSPSRKEKLSAEARRKACRAYDIRSTAEKYEECYRSILNG